MLLCSSVRAFSLSKWILLMTSGCGFSWLTFFPLWLCWYCLVARTFLRIQPGGVIVDSIIGRAVTVTCRAMPSLNRLTTLVLSHRPMRHNGSVQPRELAVTDTDDHVADRARLDHTAITGGLADRLISYTMLEVPSLCTGLADRLISDTMFEVPSLCTGLADRLISDTMFEVPSLCTGLADRLISDTMFEVPSLCTGLADRLISDTMFEVPSLCTGLADRLISDTMFEVPSLCTGLIGWLSDQLQNAWGTIIMHRLGWLSDQIHHAWGIIVMYRFGRPSDQLHHAWGSVIIVQLWLTVWSMAPCLGYHRVQEWVTITMQGGEAPSLCTDLR